MGKKRLHKAQFSAPFFFPFTYAPLSEIIKSHNLHYHFYADNIQIYIDFDPSDSDFIQTRLETCLHDIHSWLSNNMLMLNENKTEFIIFGTNKSSSRINFNSLHFGSSIIKTSSSITNLGITLDDKLSMQNHIGKLIKSVNFHLRNIALIRKYLSKRTTALIIHAFIFSRLDYCNSLLFSIPKFQINRLQRLQNSAARILTFTNKRTHITPVLRELHWLQIDARIQYKILLLS